MTLFSRAAFALALLLAAATVPAHASESSFLNRFAGSWSGSATVVNNDSPMTVTCQLTGATGGNQLAIRGHCNAGLIGRSVAADLTFDPASGRYSGTYTGDDAGPAHLSGRRNGNVVMLTITWPRPVNGDTTARMTIENTGNGVLRISLADKPAAGSLVARTNFVLSQL